MAGSIQTSGIFFEGLGDLFEQMSNEIRDAVAGFAEDTFKENLDSHIRHNGGVYTGDIQNVVEDNDRVVNDGYGETNELPYGLWLEGIGRRNSPVTVFEGYHSMEDTVAATEDEEPNIATEIVYEYVDRINNG